MLQSISSFQRNLSRIILTSNKDPKLNLAHEMALQNEYNPIFENTLFIWRNEPVVVFGKNQNPYKECNLSFIKEHNIHLARRPTGGGAVYQDLGNTNWTFISRNLSIEKDNKILQEALAHLRIKADISGRNDIEYKGKKISGSAFSKTNKNSLHHGTMMLHVNLENMVKCLTVDKSKLAAKGVDSVKARVLNIKEINPRITHQKFTRALVNVYQSVFGRCEIWHEDKSTVILNPEVVRNYQLLKSHDWLFGKCSSARSQLNKKFDFGLFDITVDVNEGRVRDITMHTDCLSNEFSDVLSHALAKCVKENSLEPLKEISQNTPKEFTKEAQVITEWLSKELSQYI